MKSFLNRTFLPVSFLGLSRFENVLFQGTLVELRPFPWGHPERKIKIQKSGKNIKSKFRANQFSLSQGVENYA